MNAIRREKFATQVNAETLAEVRGLAETEGRQLQSLIDEALSDLLEKRRQSKCESAWNLDPVTGDIGV